MFKKFIRAIFILSIAVAVNAIAQDKPAVDKLLVCTTTQALTKGNPETPAAVRAKQAVDVCAARADVNVSLSAKPQQSEDALVALTEQRMTQISAGGTYVDEDMIESAFPGVILVFDRS